MAAPEARRPELPKLLLAAAGYAAAELGVTILIGRFFDWGRAEALLFLAFRPWLLLAAALLVSGAALRWRMLFYVAALLLASVSEGLFLLGLGAADPWPQLLRGFAGGAAMAALADAVLQAGRKLGGRLGLGAATAVLIALFLLPGALGLYERLVLGRAPAASAAPKPDLMLMTALPIIWGEKGAFDAESRPAESYAYLQREFEVRPLDVLDERSLGAGRLLLLAQPRALAPEELVTLDAWVRGGGRALILTDPALAWPSELPLGDFRRPPAIGLLDPLLGHWGLALAAGRPGAAVGDLDRGTHRMRLAMMTPGRFSRNGGSCRIKLDGLFADCAIGRGRAMLLADADLMRDALWMGPLASSGERHVRIADNPLLLAAWLDGLEERDRPRAGGTVEWLGRGADRTRASLLALLPLLAAVGASLAAARVARGRA